MSTASRSAKFILKSVRILHVSCIWVRLSIGRHVELCLWHPPRVVWKSKPSPKKPRKKFSRRLSTRLSVACPIRAETLPFSWVLKANRSISLPMFSLHWLSCSRTMIWRCWRSIRWLSPVTGIFTVWTLRSPLMVMLFTDRRNSPRCMIRHRKMPARVRPLNSV